MDKPISVTKTYSLTMKHIGMIATLADEMGISQGEVIRRAVDEYFDARSSEQPPAPQSTEQAQV